MNRFWILLLLSGVIVCACNLEKKNNVSVLGDGVPCLAFPDSVLKQTVRKISEKKMSPMHFFYNVHKHQNSYVYDSMQVVLGEQYFSSDSTQFLFTIGVMYRTEAYNEKEFGKMEDFAASYILVAKKEIDSNAWCFRPLPYYSAVNMPTIYRSLFLTKRFIQDELGYERFIIGKDTLPTGCPVQKDCFWKLSVIWNAPDWHCEPCQ